MRIDLLTLFPDMCRAVLDESIIGRAQAKGLLDIRCHQIRDYTPVSYTHLTLPTTSRV